ncbi:MAG: tRNA (adenosine(37)-N6)-threonylcarbamoyltransferase complex dimerization subunit type 1 TsaB [Saprospiraceae bacterium]|nr:tRNA (adenosine(37)-N6)-threonylcarbamoyltransferase complex dimerization subunit type 1 TsaB [Saprospiraceae bacterium]
MTGIKEADKINSHAEILAVLIDELLKETQTGFFELSAVAVSTGPGSYTSLRVGLSTAKGICYAAQIPLIGLRSDHILIRGQIPSAERNNCTCIIGMIDARRMEAYTTVFDIKQQIFTESIPTILDDHPFTELENNHPHIALCGNGAKKYYELCLKNRYVLLEEKTTARWMGVLAQERFTARSFDDVAYTTPIYIKPPNITESKKKMW